jgi:hypothetical protein
MSEFKIPKTIGACADRLYAIKLAKAELAKQEKALDEEKSLLTNHIIDTLPKSEASGVAGKTARVTVVEESIPQVKDWDAFWAKFNKKNDFDLLNKALNKSAVNARLDAGKTVAGVEIFKVKKLSLNKV